MLLPHEPIEMLSRIVMMMVTMTLRRARSRDSSYLISSLPSTPISSLPIPLLSTFTLVVRIIDAIDQQPTIRWLKMRHIFNVTKFSQLSCLVLSKMCDAFYLHYSQIILTKLSKYQLPYFVSPLPWQYSTLSKYWKGSIAKLGISIQIVC